MLPQTLLGSLLVLWPQSAKMTPNRCFCSLRQGLHTWRGSLLVDYWMSQEQGGRGGSK